MLECLTCPEAQLRMGIEIGEANRLKNQALHIQPETPHFEAQRQFSNSSLNLIHAPIHANGHK